MTITDTDRKMLRCRIVLNGTDRRADANGRLVESVGEDAYGADGLAVVASFDGISVGVGSQGPQVPISITIDGIMIQAEAVAHGLKVMLRLTYGPQGTDKAESATGIALAPTGGHIGGNDGWGMVAPPVEAVALSAQDGPSSGLEVEAGLITAVPRTGYDASFIGITIPEPGLSDDMRQDSVPFGESVSIPYTHFSVCLSAKRRMARYVAWNIDGARIIKLPRTEFALDPRIDASFQWGNALYSDNVLDRGHIARRADLCWGEMDEARQANRDSFYYTNIAPQHQAYNQSSRQGLWGELEDQVFAQASVAELRLCVQAGPIFGAEDITYRDARIPSAFWKLIGWRDEDDNARLVAFVLSQEDLLSDLKTSLTFEPFHLYQVGIDELAVLTGLDFDAFPDGDILRRPGYADRRLLSNESGAKHGMILEIRSVRDIML